MEKYQRFEGPKSRLHTKNRKLRAQFEKDNEKFLEAAKSAAATELLQVENTGFLEPEHEMEKTFKVTQQEISKSVDVQTQAKKFSLSLPQTGPYTFDYSRSGNFMLLGGRKGHIASFNWKEAELQTELFVGETVRAVKYLNNDFQFFAAAQKKYTFIYNQQGTELHKLKHHIEATMLDYLPYHYLLVTAGNTGYIKYQDVSTGLLVAEMRTKLGPTASLTHNPYNAVVHAGHQNGTVTLWAPSMQEPLVKIQSSRGPARALAIDRGGNYMAVGGADRTVKIWDIRNFKCLQTYYTPTPASSLSISDTGLLAVGWGPHVQIWKDTLTRTGPKVTHPYMNHLIPSKQVEKVRFAPFEDVLGVGHSEGFESLIVPGAGEANIDSYEANPYMYATRTGRREREVKDLLEKLQPDMISLDPNVIGEIDRRSHQDRLNAAQKAALEQEQQAKDDEKLRPRINIKGKNSAIRRLYRKKTKNVMDERKQRLEQALEREKKARQKDERRNKGLLQEKETGAALRRFL